jgi:hypothetical protein
MDLGHQEALRVAGGPLDFAGARTQAEAGGGDRGGEMSIDGQGVGSSPGKAEFDRSTDGAILSVVVM